MISFAGLDFNSAAEAKRFVQSILRECPEGGLTEDAKTLLTAMLPHSPDAALIRGPYRFRVRQKMHVEIDGPMTRLFRFKWSGVITAQSAAAKVKEAARKLVEHQRPAIDLIATPNCALCQQAFKARQTIDGQVAVDEVIHQDHHPVPFKTIWSDWLVKTGLKEATIPLDRKTFAEDSLCIDWMNYHQLHARYQPTHALCNLRKK